MDLNPELGGTIHHFSDPAAGTFTVQYTGVKKFSGAGEVTFQIVLHRDGNISCYYNGGVGTNDGGVGATGDAITVGIEDADGTDGLQVASDSSYVSGGLALRYYTPSWLTAAPLEGTVQAGAGTAVALRLNAGALVAGTYHATVSVSAPGGTTNLPVTLHVSGTPSASLTPASVSFGSVRMGGTYTRTVALKNNGTADLVVSSAASSNPALGLVDTLPLTLAPAESRNLTLRLVPTAAGTLNATFTLNHNASPATSQVTASATVTEAPDISVAPASVSVTLPAGDTTTRNVTISNSGAVPLVWDAAIEDLSSGGSSPPTGGGLSGDGPRRLPNDPSFGSLWGLDNTGQDGGTADADIDAPEAWILQTGSSDVVVAVIDTGVDYNHQDLAPNIWTNPGEIPGNNLDDDGNGFVDDVHGYDFVNNDADPMDDQSHGSHCSGTIAGRGDNGKGVVGVAWMARIMAVKFLDSAGSGYLSAAINSVDYAVLNGARITSNSYGGGGYSDIFQEAVQAAADAGVLFVAAAGNSANDNDTSPTYPANYDSDNVISVAATTRNDELAYFSNYGASSVHLGAPGYHILSSTPGNAYKTYSGTSMACPHVAGAAAILLSKNTLLTPLQIRQTLMDSADDKAALDGRTASGGRLNLFNALVRTIPPWVNVSPRSGTVAPGGSQVIDLTFKAANTSVGEKLGELSILSDDPDEASVAVPLSLTVGAAAGIAIEPSALDLGDVFVGGSKTYALIVSNVGTEALTLSGATFSNPRFSTSLTFPRTIPAGGQIDLPVTVSPLATGALTGTVTIASNDATDPTISAALTANGTPAPVINTIAGTIARTLRSGETATATTTLTNTGGAPLTYAFTGDNASWLSIAPVSGTINPGGSVEVTFTLDAAGLSAGTLYAPLTLTSNDPARAQQGLVLALTVQNGAHLVLDPAATDFGVVYIGTPQTKTIIARNRGNAPLTISAVQVAGTGFTLASGTPGTINAGSTRTFTVTANPTAEGAMSGSFQVTSNDPDAATRTATLAANGRPAPAMSVTPASISAALNVGQSTTRNLTVSNAGPGTLNVSLKVDAPGTGNAFGTRLAAWNLSQKTDDRTITGIVHANGVFYACGAEFSTGVPRIYKFDDQGNLTGSFAQPGVTAGSWGFRELAWDGSYLYGGWEEGIVKFDTSGNAVGSIPKPAELGTARGLTYDPATDHFWVSDFDSDLLEIDRAGTILRRIPVATPVEHYGLAWDNVTPGGPYLWVSETFEIPNRNIHQFRVSDGQPTGVVLAVEGEGWGSGLALTTTWRPGTLVLACLSQSVDDSLYLVDIGSHQAWLAVDSLGATLAPGGSRDFTVTLDATGLDGGTHNATITVSGNDPALPSVVVPVSLAVTGIPAATLEPAALDWQNVFVNATSPQSVRVRNTGSDTLSVSGLAVSGAAFALATPDAFTLAPRESRLVTVNFTPAATGNFTGTLALNTNAPGQAALSVPLSGSSIAAPVLNLDTTPIAFTVKAGDAQSVVRALSNTGGSTLDWKTASLRTASGATIGTVTPSATNDLPGAEPRKPGKFADFIEILGTGPRTIQPVPYNENFESGSFADWYNPGGEGKKLVTSLSAGEGTYSFRYQDQTWDDHQWGIHQRLAPSQPDYVSFRLRADQNNLAAGYFTLIDAGGSYAILFFASNTGQFSLNEAMGGNTNFTYESGRWYHIEFKNMNWTARTLDYFVDGALVARGVPFAQSFANDVEYCAIYNYHQGSSAWWDDIRISTNTAAWLGSTPSTGSLAPAASQNLNIRADAAYLDPGVYDAVLEVRSNDPLRAVTNVPVTLTVEAAPAIRLPESSVAFGDAAVGSSVDRPVQVLNPGSQALVINSVSSSNPRFAVVSTLPLTVPAGGKAEMTARFSPTALGAADGTLTVSSNSPVDPTLAIAVSGTGIPAANLVPSAPSLTTTVASGANGTATFTVTNNGASAITFASYAFTEAVAATVAGSELGAQAGEIDTANKGGPDAFGYKWIDERETGANALYQWEDISTTGTKIASFDGSSTNNGQHLYQSGIPMGFTFPFYGGNHTQFTVSNSGAVYFLDRNFPTYLLSDAQLPFDYNAYNGGPNHYIALLRGGMKISPGSVYYKTTAEKAIIQYERIQDPTLTGEGSFQVILYPNGDIRMQAKTVPTWLDGRNHCSGLQGQTASGLTGVFPVNRDFTAWAAGRVFYYNRPGTPYRDWLRASASATTLNPGASATITVSYKSATLLPGTYEGRVELQPTSAGQAPLVVPVTLEVENTSPPVLTLIRNNGFNLDEGGSVAVTNLDLRAASPVAAAAGITFTHTGGGHGTFRKNGTPVTGFTQADIDAGTITFLHDGSDEATTAAASISVTDGTETLTAIGVSFTVRGVNDVPTITAPASFDVIAGRANPLAGILLDDPDIAPAYSNWDLDLSVQHGTIRLNVDLDGGVFLGTDNGVQNNGSAHVTVMTWLSRYKVTFAHATGITYTPAAGFNGTDTLRIELRDNGNAGAGNEGSAVLEIPLRVFSSDTVRWRNAHWPPADLANPSLEATQWGHMADPEGDGINNLLEYALGLDPGTADAIASKVVFNTLTEGAFDYPVLEITRDPTALDVANRFTVEVSTDLLAWRSGITHTTTRTNTAGTLRVRSNAPLSVEPRQYLRLKVTAP